MYITKTCALCSIELSQSPVSDGDNAFCCHGCHAVHNILTTKNQLSDYRANPIFQQALRSGLISNPALLEQIRQNRQKISEGDLEKLHLEIAEMWCPACAEVIRLIMLQQRGVKNCVVDYATDLASIEFSPRHISKDQIYDLIRSIGYRPLLLENNRKAVSLDLYLRFAVAVFCSLNIMMFAYPLYATYFDYDSQGYGELFAWLSFLSAIPVILYSAWPIFYRFAISLQVGLCGMEALVVISVSTGFGLSVYELLRGSTRVYFDSISVIITLVLLGKIIEAKAKFSVKDAILRLTRAIPRRGRKRFTDGSQIFVPVKEINPEDLIVVVSGEKIALDGVVTEGEGLCDESIMTGESLPVKKKIGNNVLAGSILQNGSIVVRVTSVNEGTALHKIINTVEKEIANKAVYIRAADQVVYWFVPLVLLLAIGSAIVSWFLGQTDPGSTIEQTAIIRAISVLLISCPCAIGIAVPLAESYIMNAMASCGAIVRNRGCLTVLGQETIFVFDKTGTVTEGHFTVLQGMDNLSEHHRSLLKSLTSHSNHPIASGIFQIINEPLIPLSHVEEVVGKGLKAVYGMHTLSLGSKEFLCHQGIEPIVNTKQELGSVVYFTYDNQCITSLVLGDKIREDVIETVKALAPAKTILLSGDSSAIVAAVAQTCKFDVWQAECTPLQKREYIESLCNQGHVVCMIGDGINDAPALTSAHIGISVISASDISIQVSDLLLTTDKLNIIPKVCSIARRGHAIVKQNLFWAFFYNVIGLGLAMCGALSPIFAAFAMSASSIMVLFNAKRLSR